MTSLGKNSMQKPKKNKKSTQKPKKEHVFSLLYCVLQAFHLLLKVITINPLRVEAITPCKITHNLVISFALLHIRHYYKELRNE